MKIIAIITVLLDTFCWFCALIGSFNKLLKSNAASSHIVSAPHIGQAVSTPHIGIFIFMVIFFVMNFVTLIYLLRKDKIQEDKKNQINYKKILLGIAWFAIIYFIVCFVLGGVIGALVGSSNPVNAHEVTTVAIHDFFNKYGFLLSVGAALVAILGTIKGWLPFTKNDAI